MVGNLDMLPEIERERLRSAEERTRGVDGMQVNIAVGYGGRQEITDAVRELLREEAQAGRTMTEVAESISLDDITAHLYTKGQPDPDLVIRTSGEQRMSGFMLWQSVHTELYFCEYSGPTSAAQISCVRCVTTRIVTAGGGVSASASVHN